LLLRQYHLHPRDVDDVISQALLDLVIAQKRAGVKSDNLFLVITRRRACDFWRRRKAEEKLVKSLPVSSSTYQEHGGEWIERLLQRPGVQSGRTDRRRLLGIVHLVLAGASFSEACRESAIPRGSQMRYRRVLQASLGHLSSTAAASGPEECAGRIVGKRPL
jgi:hypothetical protein